MNDPEDVEKLYNELLYAVTRKFSNETRHQTALRYIQETEKHSNDTQSSEIVKLKHENYILKNLSYGLDENGYSLGRHSDDCG